MSSSPSSAPSFSLSLSLRARVLSARSLLAFSMRRAPLFRSFSFQASSSSSSLELLSLFSFFVSVLARREEGVCFKFFYSLQKTPINLFLSRPLCVEREKKTKKDNDKHKGDEDLFFCFCGSNKKKGRKTKKEKRIELPPPQARLYISKSPILSAQIIITVGRGRKDAETTTDLGESRLFRGIQSSETLKGGENERFDGRVVRCARVCERAHWCEENIIEIVV